VHETDVDDEGERRMNDDNLVLPPRIQEEMARGTKINPAEDQKFFNRYWAHGNQTAKVGVSIPAGSLTIEYWLPVQLKETPEEYVVQLKEKCYQALARLSQFTQLHLADVMNRYAFRMRYQGNELRIWFAREDYRKSVKSLAEQTLPKDRWFGPDEIEVVTFPPIEKDAAPPIAKALFGPNITGGDSVPNPETPGGNIALVETMIIITHLLGLAPAAYLAAPDNGP
jgi:hypothetical protein